MAFTKLPSYVFQGQLVAACSDLPPCHFYSVTPMMFAILLLAMTIHTGCQLQHQCQKTWNQSLAAPYSPILAGMSLITSAPLPTYTDNIIYFEQQNAKYRWVKLSKCKSTMPVANTLTRLAITISLCEQKNLWGSSRNISNWSYWNPTSSHSSIIWSCFFQSACLS